MNLPKASEGKSRCTENSVQLVPIAAPAGPLKPPLKISMAGLKLISFEITVGPLTVV